jgi:Uncharacterized protein conserved in bacteria
MHILDDTRMSAKVGGVRRGAGASKEESPKVEVLKVSATSKPKAVAGALAAVVREKGVVEIQAVGAGAVNQGVKAIAIARGFVAPNGIDLVCVPAFSEIEIDGEERTAIRFIVGPR